MSSPSQLIHTLIYKNFQKHHSIVSQDFKSQTTNPTSNMSAIKKIIAVIGATGGQGGSVVKTLLADPKMSAEWAIRGITRDASKESSKKLASQGVEVVTVSPLHSSFKPASCSSPVTKQKSPLNFRIHTPSSATGEGILKRLTSLMPKYREMSVPRRACLLLSRALMPSSQ